MSDIDPYDSAIEAAEALQNDLEAIADSELPFAPDAEAILSEIEDDE